MQPNKSKLLSSRPNSAEIENQDTPPQAHSFFMLIAPFFLWGTAMVAMKGVIPQTTPLFMASFRLVPAGILVLVAAAILGKQQPSTAKAWWWIAAFALVDGTMFQGFLAFGLVKTGAGLGSVMIDSQPLAVAILSRWLFGEVIGVWGATGLALGIAGISLIGLPDAWFAAFAAGQFGQINLSIENLFNSGEALMLLASLSMAVGTVMIRPVARQVDPVVATGWHMILGGVPLSIASYFWEQGQLTINPQGWMALGYASIFGSAIAYGIFFYLANSGSLTSLSSLTFLTPVFALLFSNLLLGERLSVLQWCGVGLTIASISLINQREQLDRLVKSNILLWSHKIDESSDRLS